MQGFKKELIFGSLGVIFSIGLVIFYGFQYQNQAQPITQSPTNVNLTLTEVEKHSSSKDCWVIIKNNVYDVTAYAALHPGGVEKIDRYCGKDMTQAFLNQPHSGTADTLHAMMLLGAIK